MTTSPFDYYVIRATCVTSDLCDQTPISPASTRKERSLVGARESSPSLRICSSVGGKFFLLGDPKITLAVLSAHTRHLPLTTSCAKLSCRWCVCVCLCGCACVRVCEESDSNFKVVIRAAQVSQDAAEAARKRTRTPYLASVALTSRG